jgi:prevent-host-death family protein
MTALDETRSISVTEARNHIGDLARAARAGTPVTLTDHGHAVAVLVSPELIANLEEAAAIERHLREKAEGSLVTVPHDEVLRELGIDP